ARDQLRVAGRLEGMAGDEVLVGPIGRLPAAAGAQDAPGGRRARRVVDLVEEDLVHPALPGLAGEPVAQQPGVIGRLGGLGDLARLPAGLGPAERLVPPT